MATVGFHQADRKFVFSKKTLLKDFIAEVFKKEKRTLQKIDYIFCSDPYLLQINTDFLRHDYYTDIITFRLSEKPLPVEAEVYISLDRVRDNAKQLQCSYRSELIRVIIHGALHLCGYNDKKKSEIIQMRKKEDQYLRLFEKRLLHA